MPMTAVTTAIAANAAVQSSIAASEAAAANRTSCIAFMNNYDSKSASVVAMQQYSECVQDIYPADSAPDLVSKTIIGSLMLFLLLGVLLGAYRKFKRHGCRDSLDYFEVFFIYPLVAFCLWAAVWGIYAGLCYILS